MSFIGIRLRKHLAYAHVAQLAERVLGKDEVISSILIMGSSFVTALAKERQPIKAGDSNGKRRVPKN